MLSSVSAIPLGEGRCETGLVYFGPGEVVKEEQLDSGALCVTLDLQQLQPSSSD